jgi:MFS transporter, PAT family, beta-lactamase induction signal transducer AmpG
LGVAVGVGKLVLATGWVNRDMVIETYVEPAREFFQRYGVKVALLLLALVGLYRISDIVLGVISNVFYQDLDFTKDQIATVVKTFGLAMTILGGFLGGILSVHYGVMRILFVGALLTVVTNLFFILLAVVGNNELLLYLVISADNLTAGLASAAFIAFLSSLTNVRFTAVQYAIFSSLMTLVPKVIGGYSGTMVDSFGYINFFIVAALLGIPVLALVWAAGRHVELELPVQPKS